MSSAYVQAIEALGELRIALLRYKSEAQGALDAAGVEIQRTRQWLQERLHHWQKELSRRQAILREAEAAFNKCRAQAYRDPETGRTYVPDCSREQAIVMQVRRLVQEAEQELRTVQVYMKRVEEAIGSYQQQARRLAGTLDGDLLKGSTLLSNSVTILSSYAAGAIISTGIGVASIMSSSGVSMHTAAERGAFSISDWTGYPASATRPMGPFKVIQGEEYIVARVQGNAAIREYRNALHRNRRVKRFITFIQSNLVATRATLQTYSHFPSPIMMPSLRGGEECRLF